MDKSKLWFIVVKTLKNTLQWKLKYIHLRNWACKYRQVSNIRRNLIGNETVDHSDVVGASPVGAAPTTSSFST